MRMIPKRGGRDVAVSYGCDNVGNRTSLMVNGATTASTFDAADRLTTSGADTYGYNANGDLTSKTVGGVTTTYAYDQLDRLTSINGGATAAYAYNGAGLRTSKTVGGVTATYAWDQTGLGTVVGDGASEYVWGAELVSQVTAGGVATYAHADGLGSIRLLTAATGAVVGTQQYDAFGGTRAQAGAQLPFTYTGEQLDPESGLVYLRARYLDPATGRFLSKDPFAGMTDQPATLHRYAYVGNQPVGLTDPTGRYWGEDVVNGVTDAASDVWDATTGAVSQISASDVSTFLDSTALLEESIAATVTDTLAVGSCGLALIAPAFSCWSGYFLGLTLTAPLQVGANLLSTVATAVTCASNGVTSYECLTGVGITAAGWISPDPNLDCVFDTLTIGRDTGKVPF